jgi:ATP-binding cassette subfamily F protein uup
MVIEAERVSKSYGGRPIVRDFSIRVMRGDRIGVVGANGAGKTTLVNLLTGALAPDSGSVRLGANVLAASLDQTRSPLKSATTLMDALTGGGSDSGTINGGRRHVAGYMKDFLFQPEQARTPIGKLSGGERGRLMLAKALATPSNLMVLDEPTNDLDVETLDLLQELLGDYAGTILLVSHDRDFLDRVATSVIVSEGDGRWVEYSGGYSDMVAQRGRALAGLRQSPRARESKPDGRLVDPAPQKRKLSFNEARSLEALPKRIEELRTDFEALERQLADADFPAREPAAFLDATRAYAELRDALAGAEDEWLGLEILREELERQ